MKNKKAIQLSINFLVTLIIAIVLFTMGIKFAYDLLSKGEELEKMSQDDLDARIEQLFCSSNELFCISTSTKTIQRGKSHIFGITVHNVKQNRKFKLKIAPSRAFDKNDNMIPFSEADARGMDPLPKQKEFSLEPNQDEKTGVRIGVPKDASKGTYIYNVDVEYSIDNGASWNNYDATKKLYVNVP
jgi:hypothetical protein